jgi:hypothetical protein
MFFSGFSISVLRVVLRILRRVVISRRGVTMLLLGGVSFPLVLVDALELSCAKAVNPQSSSATNKIEIRFI